MQVRKTYGEKFGPMSYYSLTRTYLRLVLREAYPRRRRRFFLPPFDAVPRRRCITTHPKPDVSQAWHARTPPVSDGTHAKPDVTLNMHARPPECADERTPLQ
jgi:hypothetical protein